MNGFVCRGSDGVLRLYDEDGVSVVLTSAEVKRYGTAFLNALNRGAPDVP